MGTTKANQAIINHFALVLDESSSMHHRKDDLIKVVDSYIEHLALKSIEMGQENRITAYTFSYANKIECMFYDMGALFLPSIKEYYKPDGWTALRDGTNKALTDLAKTPELYGDHAFMTLVFTDGQENCSVITASQLNTKIESLPENWTVAVMVPDDNCKRQAEAFGFPRDNIAIWSTTGAKGGMEEVGNTIRQATDTFMTGRASGLRGTKNLFSTGVDNVNAETVASLGLSPLHKDQFLLTTVGPSSHDMEIRDFIQSINGGEYTAGQAFVELVKDEKVQAQKYLAVVERATGKVYIGDKVRGLLGLPDYEVKVRPEKNKIYATYMQSTSTNRKMKAGQSVLVLK